MPIKETRHPEGMIDLRIVPFSRVATNTIKKMYQIPLNHHVLVVDMGEDEPYNYKPSKEFMEIADKSLKELKQRYGIKEDD